MHPNPNSIEFIIKQTGRKVKIKIQYIRANRVYRPAFSRRTRHKKDMVLSAVKEALVKQA
jgi:hypothetical protein